MKHLFAIFFFVFVGMSAATAQQVNINKNFKKQRQSVPKLNSTVAGIAARPGGAIARVHCGFNRMLEKAKARGYDETAYETALKRMVQRRIVSNQTAFTGIVTIPVVFHCIYRTGQAVSATTPNLTAAMYQAQINQLNTDYANHSGSVYGVAANVRIQFCLAVVDTTGRVLAEPGIDRINGASRGWDNTNTMDDATLEDYFDNTVKPASIWDPYSYFNVWTAAMSSSGLLGYSTFPSLSTLDGLDETETSSTAGCVINWASIGSVSVPGQDADFGLGRTLSHESGHFFGLRHIWGDDNCGNDYCADTPPQDQETSGCPATGTSNNCTPAGPKMFENYMDYTDDACVNTFTADQALRCQAAMDNSPRRFSLMASKACQARAANAIGFSTAAPYTVTETGNAGACPNSKTYSFNLYVSGAATGAATVTFTVLGSTATQGVDYTISPASVTYTAADNAVKTVTITVNDDQALEPTEDIQLGYIITGSGVVAGPDKQTVNLSIADDDISGVTVNTVTPSPVLLTQNFNASTNIPTGWTTTAFDDGSASYTPNQWVVSANGGTGTSGNAAHITRNTGTKPNQYNSNNLSDAYLFTPLVDGTGVGDISLSFKWRCLGEEGYDEGYVGYIPEGQALNADNVIYFDTVFAGLAAGTAAQTATLNMPVALSNSRFYLVFNWFNDDSFGDNPGFTIDDVSVTGKHFSIATTVDADTSFSQSSGQAVNYYSKTATANNLIATIANPSQDLGCVSATIQSAGTGKTLLATTTGSYYRTNKVITITPATANSTASYDATLYFTVAELSPTWTAAEIPVMKILKVRDGVDVSTTINASDVVLVTPTFTDNTAGGYYSYTGNFTGFSQFMLVIPNGVVPVGLLGFDAKANKNSITLNWSTSQELNNKGFTVERSVNGTSFESIGWVDGKSNSNIKTAYTFNDNFVQPGIVYYYRLRQVDANGRESIFPVRQASISKMGITVTVSPVPAKDVMNVFVKGSVQNASINLVNAQGQLIKTWSNVNASNSAYALNVASLPGGVYVLNIILPEEKIVKKVMIEK